MTVKELREKLATFPEDLPVYFEDAEHGSLPVRKVEELDDVLPRGNWGGTTIRAVLLDT